MGNERWQERWDTRRGKTRPKVDESKPGRPIGSFAGWLDDPSRPGIQRYWANGSWDDTIPPRQKPQSTWRGARVVALGILIAAGMIFLVYQINEPSELDCSRQEVEVALGERSSVDPACEGRY